MEIVVFVQFCPMPVTSRLYNLYLDSRHVKPCPFADDDKFTVFHAPVAR